jgi:hypothetical protein
MVNFSDLLDTVAQKQDEVTKAEIEKLRPAYMEWSNSFTTLRDQLQSAYQVGEDTVSKVKGWGFLNPHNHGCYNQWQGVGASGHGYNFGFGIGSELLSARISFRGKGTGGSPEDCIPDERIYGRESVSDQLEGFDSLSENLINSYRRYENIDISREIKNINNKLVNMASRARNFGMIYHLKTNFGELLLPLNYNTIKDIEKRRESNDHNQALALYGEENEKGSLFEDLTKVGFAACYDENSFLRLKEQIEDYKKSSKFDFRSFSLWQLLLLTPSKK